MANEAFFTEAKKDFFQGESNSKNLCGLTEAEIDVMVKSFFPPKKKNTPLLKSFFQRTR